MQSCYSSTSEDSLPEVGWPSHSTILTRELSTHQEFIEKYLGIPLTEVAAVQLQYGIEFTPLRQVLLGNELNHPLTIIRDDDHMTPMQDALQHEIDQVERVDEFQDVLNMISHWSGNILNEITLEHGTGLRPIGFRMKHINVRLVFFQINYVAGPNATMDCSKYYTLIDRKCIQAYAVYWRDLRIKHRRKGSSLKTIDGKSGGGTDWTDEPVTNAKIVDLVLDESVANLVQRDVETFYAREQWFRDHGLPFRRGYLLHGPPGNGKTSLIRQLMNKLRVNAYTIRLFSPHVNDAVLAALYKEAHNNAPSIILYEDLDRAFPKNGDKKTNVSLQAMLNHMDGIANQGGVITIATANEPTALDAAILKRPGRFDRTVLFDNPEDGLRLRYFQLKAPHLSAEELKSAIRETDGFSFSQLQETYILAGQSAYEAGIDDVTAEGLTKGAHTLRDTNQLTKKRGHVGFAAPAHA